MGSIMLKIYHITLFYLATTIVRYTTVVLLFVPNTMVVVVTTKNKTFFVIHISLTQNSFTDLTLSRFLSIV